MSGIFQINEDGQLVEMTEQPYESEDVLQELLARFPKLLTGSVSGDWLLVSREAGLPDSDSGASRWSVDHLFLDAEAVPTLVEVKRSPDTRIRREVVGQMLDYAANAVRYWSIEALQSAFERTCKSTNVDPDRVISEFFGQEDVEGIWRDVKTNLQAGRMRLVFVADEIPSELRRVVEFLNEQMDPAEVLAIEVKQFEGGGLKTLVPRLIGNTAAAENRKQVGGRASHWTEDEFFAKLRERDAEEVAVAKRILDLSKDNVSRIYYGKGRLHGSLMPTLDHRLPTGHVVIVLWTWGDMAVQFGYMKDRPPFDSRELRLELCHRLNQIDGVALAKEVVEGKYPSIPLILFKDEERMRQLIDVLEWAFGEVSKS